MFDANNDNSISMSEIRAVLEQCKFVDSEGLTDKALKEIGKQAGKSTSLTFGEFKLFIKNLFA